MTAIEFEPGDPATIRSPFETYRRLRDEDPVHRLSGHPDTFVLSRFDDVFAAARDTTTFSSASGLTLDGGDRKALGLAPTIVMMDPPQHTAFRRLVSRGFTPRHVTELEPAIRAFVADRLDRMSQRLDEDGIVDVIDALAKPLPSFVVAAYLGVPEEDRPRFDGWSHAIVSANAEGDVIGRAAAAVGELYRYFGELIERRRDEPADDLVSQLLAADVDGAELTVEEVLGFAFVMIAGGNDTTTGLIGGALELLSLWPDQRRRLVAEPGLLPGAVEEFLRLTSPVQGLGRLVTADVTMHGTTIRAGQRVHLLYGAANRDPREFGPDAEALDVGRDIRRILTFSSGPHFCLGASAARLQGRIALEELLARFPDFEVDVDAAEYAPGGFVRRFASLPFGVLSDPAAADGPPPPGGTVGSHRRGRVATLPLG